MTVFKKNCSTFEQVVLPGDWLLINTCIIITSRVPVEEKSSVCVISMKYTYTPPSLFDASQP